MNIPADLKYTKDHEWLRLDGDTAVVGITDFAQGELGDIVFVDIKAGDDALASEAVFGTIEAVKTVSDLFMPVSGTVVEVNPALADNAALVNTDPYGQGWMVRIKLSNPSEADGLMSAQAYSELVGG